MDGEALEIITGLMVPFLRALSAETLSARDDFFGDSGEPLDSNSESEFEGSLSFSDDIFTKKGEPGAWQGRQDKSE